MGDDRAWAKNGFLNERGVLTLVEQLASRGKRCQDL